MNELNGLLLVDKPVGITSHDVVARVRRLFKMKSVGHTGTLDPMASGLMVLLLGEGTKVSDFLLKGDKGYQLKSRLGVTTDSLDITGEILTESAVNIDPERIVSVVADLQGEVKLPIPMFSAKKLNGKKLYEYARAGERIEIPQKVMNFYDFKDLQINSPEVQLEFRCSKGSFVRSWSSEFGTRLGVGAALAELRRTYSAPYSIEKALPLDEIAQRLESQRGVEPSGELEITESLCSALLGPAFLPLAEALPNLPAFTITGKDERLLFNGQVPQVLQRRMIQIQKRVNQEDHGEMVRILSGSTGRLQAIVEVSPKKSLKIRRNFR